MELPSSSRLCHYYAVCVAQGFNRATDTHYQLFGTRVVQSTLSRSVADIELHAGQCIVREPFGLTPKGNTVFSYAKDMVEKFAAWKKLNAADSEVVHNGAPEYCVREYLLALQTRAEEKHGLRLRFHACTEQEIFTSLMNGVLQLGVCALNRPLPPVLQSRALAEIDPVLLLPTSGKNGAGHYRNVKKAAELWAQQKLPGRLICADEMHSVRTVFDEGLAAMKVTWADREIAPSVALITMMVAASGHAGLSLNLNKLKTYNGVSALELPGFPKVRYGPVWREPLSEPLKKVLREIEILAAELKLTSLDIRAKPGVRQPVTSNRLPNDRR